MLGKNSEHYKSHQCRIGDDEKTLLGVKTGYKRIEAMEEVAMMGPTGFKTEPAVRVLVYFNYEN